MNENTMPVDYNTVANIVVGRAVKISELLHTHNEEWPDYPELPLRPVALVENGFPMLTREARGEFFSILPRYRYLQGESGPEPQHGMSPSRLEFETTQLTLICVEAWRLAPMEETWAAAQKILSQLE